MIHTDIETTARPTPDPKEPILHEADGINIQRLLKILSFGFGLLDHEGSADQNAIQCGIGAFIESVPAAAPAFPLLFVLGLLYRARRRE